VSTDRNIHPRGQSSARRKGKQKKYINEIKEALVCGRIFWSYFCALTLGFDLEKRGCVRKLHVLVKIQRNKFLRRIVLNKVRGGITRTEKVT
jgi:hypothetical protein